MIRKLLLVAALAAAAPASAEESPRWGTFQFSLGGYRPNIDADLVSTKPYQRIFGTGSNIMFRVDAAYSIFTSWGSLDAGLGLGYWSKTGRALLLDRVTRSSDDTGLKILPTRVTLTYRFDMLANRYRWFPIAPYARVSFDRYWWWVTNGAGNLAKANGKSGRGATNGYSFGGGIALNLNAIDPDLARDMDNSMGVNATYAFVDFNKSYVSDFHSPTSWNLSDSHAVTISGGLMFVF